jgi:ribulose-5-phosphate 4-epimerase/fuculose-1-phosphate aldolase
MEKLIAKYESKLVAQGLCDPGTPLICGIDADVTWNRTGGLTAELEKVARGLNINSLIFARPAGPMKSILDRVALESLDHDGVIRPQDTETRTFLHDIPVIPRFNHKDIIDKLKKRKSVVIPGHGIVTFGTVSPEQAFVTFSSVCFSCFVKFFVDYYYSLNCGAAQPEDKKSLMRTAILSYKNFITSLEPKTLAHGPFQEAGDIIRAMAEAGRLTVSSRLVDSFFGNISYKYGDAIYISQTGSSLDELEGYIDRCPTDGTSTNAITSSSEYSAHKSIYGLRNVSAILHGHPKFAVIISMICDELACVNRGACHIKCDKNRTIQDIPVTCGEVGTGPRGLCNTLPAALTGRGAIVYGHGLFTAGTVDFNEAYSSMLDIELMCLKRYEKLMF